MVQPQHDEVLPFALGFLAVKTGAKVTVSLLFDCCGLTLLGLILVTLAGKPIMAFDTEAVVIYWARRHLMNMAPLPWTVKLAFSPLHSIVSGRRDILSRLALMGHTSTVHFDGSMKG